MPVITVAGSVLRRCLICAALVIGLVAMHHLVATGCATVMGSHEHGGASSVLAEDPSSSERVSSGLLALDTHPAAASDHEAAPAGTAPLGGAMSVCLAALVLLLVLRRPATWLAVFIRERKRTPSMAMRQRSLVEQPPDLDLLSISRT